MNTIHDYAIRIDFDIIRFYATECWKQHSGEMSVYQMCLACRDAQSMSWVDSTKIEQLGMQVEPTKNEDGFRRTPVIVMGGLRQPLPAAYIRHALDSLLASVETITPAEFYQEFETIHPFVDGNGRVGAILYNWYKGTLNYPVVPPVFGGV